MPTKPKIDQDTADEQPVKLPSRLAGARLIAGQWHDANGVLLSDKESQLAHRAADKVAAEARRRALLGGDV